MAGKYIGIDLGCEFVKITVHENHKICGEICERIPEHLLMDGTFVSVESAAEFLKEIGKKHGLFRCEACVVLPEHLVITKRIRMTKMDPKHLMLNLPYEFYDYLEHSVEEWVCDYSLAELESGEGTSDGTVDLWAAAVPARVVEWYQKLIRMAGWKLSVMAPASSAISNLLEVASEKQKISRNCCVMDFGNSGIRLYFYKNGLLFAKRGLENYDTDEKLLFELEKIWDYYQTVYPENQPERIYVTGGKRNVSLEGLIRNYLNVEICNWTELLDDTRNMTREMISAEAAGITYRREKKSINFTFYKGKRNRKKYLPVLPGVLLLGLLSWCVFISPLRDLGVQKRALDQKQKELETLLAENQGYDDTEEMFRQWSGAEEEHMEQDRFRTEFMELLKNEVFSDGNVEEMELSGNQCRILLSGWSLEKTVETMERIESSPLVTHVELVGHSEKTEIEILLTGGEDHES